MFKGIPSFSPEIFQELENLDPQKTKQLEKGIRQLTDEGVAQMFVQPRLLAAVNRPVMHLLSGYPPHIPAVRTSTRG